MGVFSFRKNGTDSVNQVGSGNIKFLAQFPGNDFESDFEIFNDFLNCLGGILVCRCFTLKITQFVALIKVVIFIYEIRDASLVLSKLTQF